MAYTTPSTQPTGTLITSTMYAAHIINNIKFLHGPPTARAHRDAAQSITSGAWNPIQFDTEEWDTNTIWSSTSNTKFFCRAAGKYLVMVFGGFANSSAGSLRGVAIQKNTTATGSGHEAAALFATTALTAVNPRLHASMLVALTTGQFVRMEMFQDSGAGLNTSTDDTVKPRLSMIWMSS